MVAKHNLIIYSNYIISKNYIQMYTILFYILISKNYTIVFQQNHMYIQICFMSHLRFFYCSYLSFFPWRVVFFLGGFTGLFIHLVLLWLSLLLCSMQKLLSSFVSSLCILEGKQSCATLLDSKFEKCVFVSSEAVKVIFFFFFFGCFCFY